MLPSEMLTALRQNIGESVEGNWLDTELQGHLNRAQDWLARLIMTIDNQMFRATHTFSLVAGQELYKLPPRCGSVAFVEYTNGGVTEKMQKAVEMHRSTYDDFGVLSYYLRGRYIGILPVADSSLANAVTVHYQERLPVMHSGEMQSATTLDTTASQENDYYNGSEIVLTGGAGVDGDRAMISDYVGSTRTITLDSSGWAQGSTPDTTSDYEIVCKIPEEYHELIILRATVNALAKDEDQAVRFRTLYKDSVEGLLATYGQDSEPEFVKDYM